MFDIGGPELLVILLGVIVLFGPKKIPKVAQMIGKGIQKVRSAQSQFKEQIDEIQTELAVINKTDFIKDFNPPIREINASELKKEHFSDNSLSKNSLISDSEDEINTKVSDDNGFSPIRPIVPENEPYNLDSLEKDDDSAESHLNGTSHGLKG